MGFIVSKSNGTSDWPKGVYIDRLEITTIESVESQFGHDISIKITGDTPDKPKSLYPTSLYLNGNHAKDQGKSVDWGSNKSEPPVRGGSWKIKHFLEKLGIESKSPMTEDFSQLNEDCIRDCIGRSVYILQYETNKMNKNGNPKRQTWFWFASEEEGKKSLLDKWRSFKDKPRDYKMDGSQKLSNMWANKPSSEESTVPEV